MKTREEWIEEVMEQAQVFASYHSIVGSRFDDGDGMERAEIEKNELRAMLLVVPDTDVWQPISTAPKDGSHILLCGIVTEVKVTSGYWYQKKERWIAGGYMTETEGFTHWMPLPKEPTCEK